MTPEEVKIFVNEKAKKIDEIETQIRERYINYMKSIKGDEKEV